MSYRCTRIRGGNDDHHKHRRLYPEGFLDNGVEIGHVVQKLEGHGVVGITTNAVLLFANLGEDFGMVSQVLEGVDQAAAHRILTGEQEGEDDHCHLAVTEFFTTFPFGILNGLEPTVKHACGFTAVCHMDLAFGGGFNEPLEGNLTSLNCPPDLCSREGEREVYELKGASDIPILVANLLRGDLGNVISAEYTQRGVHVEMTGDHHDGMGFSVGGEPITEVLSGNLVLNVKVKAVK